MSLSLPASLTKITHTAVHAHRPASPMVPGLITLTLRLSLPLSSVYSSQSSRSEERSFRDPCPESGGVTPTPTQHPRVPGGSRLLSPCREAETFLASIPPWVPIVYHSAWGTGGTSHTFRYCLKKEITSSSSRCSLLLDLQYMSLCSKISKWNNIKSAACDLLALRKACSSVPLS